MMKISFSFENPLKIKFGDDFFKNVPVEAGVYYFLDADRKPLYIGKADSLKKRLASYKLAKPGSAPEHILEMIEHASEIVWEKYPNGQKALVRESELIRTLQPPFNIVGTEPVPFLFCGLKMARKSVKPTTHIEFRLSHQEIASDFAKFGCFVHRGRTKAGYSALLRLLHVVGREPAPSRRLALPAKLCRTSPAYIHKAEIKTEFVEPLISFLKGESPALLKLITKTLLANEDLPAYLYAPLQRDLKTAMEFFESCTSQTHALLRKHSAASTKRAKPTFMSHKAMMRILSDANKAVPPSMISHSLTAEV